MAPCPYLPGRNERKVFTELRGPNADALNDALGRIGFRRSQTVDTARKNLVENFKFSEIQAQAILDMQLRRLAALERKKLQEEFDELRKRIAVVDSTPGKAKPRVVESCRTGFIYSRSEGHEVILRKVEVRTSIPPLNFTDCWKRRKTSRQDDFSMHYLGLEDLKTAKRHAGRQVDLADLEEISRTHP